jgi:predicted aspartyl protease
MATIIGFIGKSGSPCIKLTIEGTFPDSGQEFEVTVDTGFTGFISMPIMMALPLGLALYGTTSVQFGDGKTSTRFTALAVARLGVDSEAGVVILEPSHDTILVGMEFLNAFKKTVFMHRGMLMMMDQTEVDKTISEETIQQIKAAQDALNNPAPPPDTQI